MVLDMDSPIWFNVAKRLRDPRAVKSKTIHCQGSAMLPGETQLDIADQSVSVALSVLITFIVDQFVKKREC